MEHFLIRKIIKILGYVWLMENLKKNARERMNNGVAGGLERRRMDDRKPTLPRCDIQ